MRDLFPWVPRSPTRNTIKKIGVSCKLSLRLRRILTALSRTLDRGPVSPERVDDQSGWSGCLPTASRTQQNHVEPDGPNQPRDSSTGDIPTNSSVNGGDRDPMNSKPFRIVTFALVVTVAVLLGISAYQPVTAHSWKSSHWLFGYEFGFTKRGLVGALMLSGVQPPIELSTLNSLATFATLTLISVTALLCLSTVYLLNVSWDGVFLAGSFLTSSYTLRYILYDNGRFDILNSLIVLFTIPLVFSGRRFFLFVAFVLATVTLFVHEASIFLSIPVLVGTGLLYSALKTSELSLRTYLRSLAFGSLLIGGSLAVLIGLGTPDVPQGTYDAYLKSVSAFSPNSRSLRVLYTSLLENLRRTYHQKLQFSAMLHSTPGILGAVPFVILAMAALREQLDHLDLTIQPKVVYFLLLGLTMFPLFLFAIGRDWLRWVSWITINSYLIYFLTCVVAASMNQPVVETPIRNRLFRRRFVGGLLLFAILVFATSFDPSVLHLRTTPLHKVLSLGVW